MTLWHIMTLWHYDKGLLRWTGGSRQALTHSHSHTAIGPIYLVPWNRGLKKGEILLFHLLNPSKEPALVMLFICLFIVIFTVTFEHRHENKSCSAVTVTVSVIFLCWSLAHAEQLLFSCVSSKGSICNYVTCRMSHVACHMSYVLCQMLMLILGTCWTIFVFMSRLKSRCL